MARRSSGSHSTSRTLLARLLMLACLSRAAFGFATPPSQAVLNRLTNQQNITTLGSGFEQNPYGLAAIPKSMGKLQAGNFLTTQWNDVLNRPGQGHTILQVTPQGATSTFATINTTLPSVQQACGNFGVGLTMGLVVLSKGYVIVGSTPLAAPANIPGAGCLLVLDANGNLLDAHAANETTTSPGVMTGGGPWAMAVSETNGGSNANLFVSYVVGTCPTCTETQTGPNGGMVVRYQLLVPGGGFSTQFWNGPPEVIASGFPTQPGNIANGAVGPTGLVLGTAAPNYPGHVENYLFIANNLNNSVVKVPQANGCFTHGGFPPQCILKTVAWNGIINGPIGLAQSPYGTIVGANGGIGTLFEIAPLPFANMQLANQLVDNAAATVAGAGNLFNVLFINNGNTLVFNDDNSNTYNTLTASSPSMGRKFL